MIYQRDIYPTLVSYMQIHDVILLYGARQVGKTSLMKSLLEYEKGLDHATVFVDLEDGTQLSLINQGPQVYIDYLTRLHGFSPGDNFTLFIDEVQYMDEPTSFCKYVHDHTSIKLVVSGSSTLDIRDKMKDSMAGRLIKIDIYPLTFAECLRFRDKEGLYRTKDIQASQDELGVLRGEYMMYGGFPKVVLAREHHLKKLFIQQIVEAYIQKDIKDIARIVHIDIFNKLILLLCHQVGNLVNHRELSQTLGISVVTLSNWINILKHTFVYHEITPYYSNIRKSLTKMPKGYMIDSGIINYITTQRESSGSGFEQSVIMDQIKQGNKIQFIRTQDGKELDMITETHGYEIKLRYDGKKIPGFELYHTSTQQPYGVVTLQPDSSDKYPQYYPWEI